MINFNDMTDDQFKEVDSHLNIIKFYLFIICVLLLLQTCTSVLNAQVSIYAGDSESSGLVGVELKYSHVSVSTGWRPASYGIESISQALTYYQIIDDKMWYIRAATASEGISHYSDDGWDVISERSYLALIGFRCNLNYIEPKISDRFKIDAGVGVNTTFHRTLITFDMLFNFSLVKFRKSYEYTYQSK